MSTPIETAFAELCAKHNLSRIDIGAYATGRCIATVWWDGFARSGTACQMANGDTAQEALNAAISMANADRVAVEPDVPALALAEAA